jgi:hypothetical protein
MASPDGGDSREEGRGGEYVLFLARLREKTIARGEGANKIYVGCGGRRRLSTQLWIGAMSMAGLKSLLEILQGRGQCTFQNYKQRNKWWNARPLDDGFGMTYSLLVDHVTCDLHYTPYLHIHVSYM